MDDYFVNGVPANSDDELDEATAECQHHLIFTVWDEPVSVFVCECCGTVFTGAMTDMETELAKPFADALEWQQ